LDSLAQFSLAGRVALVTGATRGLGWAMAQALAGAGAHVVLNGRDQEALAARQAELQEAGHAASIARFDVRDTLTPVVAIGDIDRALGRLDILVNNAGIIPRKPVLETADDEWQAAIDIDLSAAFRLSREAARLMVRQRWGRIINIGSIMGSIARPTVPAYVTAKAGLAGLTRALAVELGPQGVTVNCIAPGFFPSDATEILHADPDFNARIATRAPLGRWGDVTELGGAVIFLASHAASYCTGQVITVDGGLTVAL
jgi:gluconate 5-dehydrogenase